LRLNPAVKTAGYFHNCPVRDKIPARQKNFEGAEFCRMKAVKIKDMEIGRNFLAVDLRHVLTALGERSITSDWRVRDVWATGNSETQFANLDEQQTISGLVLKELADNVIQIIDGVFSAFERGHSQPWVIVEAVDSSFYTVHSDDALVLDNIRNKFRLVTDYDQPVHQY
jgi:hypothetical protein